MAEVKVSDSERAGRALTTVVFLTPYRNAMGQNWGTAERAGFPEEEARDLIRRGIARPPSDKMVHGDKTLTK